MYPIWHCQIALKRAKLPLTEVRQSRGQREWVLFLSQGLFYTCGLWSVRKEMATHPSILPGKSHGQWSLVGYSPWGRRESDTTEWLHFHFLWSLMQLTVCNCSQKPAFLVPGDAGWGCLCGSQLWGRSGLRARRWSLVEMGSRQWLPPKPSPLLLLFY